MSEATYLKVRFGLNCWKIQPLNVTFSKTGCFDVGASLSQLSFFLLLRPNLLRGHKTRFVTGVQKRVE